MSKAKQKGTAFETKMVNYFREAGFPDARRNPLAGSKDVGDIGGMPLPIECKAVEKMALPQWLREAAAEAENANAPFCPVVHKRRGVGDPAKQYVAIEAWMLVELMKHYRFEN